LLWAHVRSRSDDRAERRSLGQRRRLRGIRRGVVVRSESFGETEVENLWLSVGPNFDVRGLQISMDDAFFVRDLETLGNLQQERDGFIDGRPAAMRSANVSPSMYSITMKSTPFCSPTS